MITRSGALLTSVVASGGFTVQQVAQELRVSVEDVESYAGGQAVMPLSQQKCLALFVIKNSPRFASRGHALEAQVAAATTFKAHATKVHDGPPVRWSAGRRK